MSFGAELGEEMSRVRQRGRDILEIFAEAAAHGGMQHERSLRHLQRAVGGTAERAPRQPRKSRATGAPRHVHTPSKQAPGEPGSETRRAWERRVWKAHAAGRIDWTVERSQRVAPLPRGRRPKAAA